jgi:hypothetical protein
VGVQAVNKDQEINELRRALAAEQNAIRALVAVNESLREEIDRLNREIAALRKKN